MVQIVSKVGFIFIVVFIFSNTICSCSILRSNTECKLIPENNETIGNDKNAPTLEIKSRYFKVLIKHLFGIPRPRSIRAHNLGYSHMENPLYIGFKITGCKDTTRAKITMADHLMNKYGYIRKDSFYLDTAYRIEIIDPDKLPIQNEECNKNIFVIDEDSTTLYQVRPCVEWNSFFLNIVNDFCHNQHCYPLEIP